VAGYFGRIRCVQSLRTNDGTVCARSGGQVAARDSGFHCEFKTNLPPAHKLDIQLR
jgi:hypothetical protein